MWKPGTSKTKKKKRKNGESPGESPPPPVLPKDGPAPSLDEAKKAKNNKKLSGSTMGMRFMQRARADPVVRQEEDVVMASNDAEDEEEATLDAATQAAATPSDMYGVQYIGRRSFCDFNKAVHKQWKAQQNNKPLNKKSTATDEELVQRYQQYVKGRESGLEATAKHKPVGNLGDKLNKKKRKASNNGGGSASKKR